MRTVDDLRAALDDADTPVGIDVPAIRRRATRQRQQVIGTVITAASLAAVVAIPSAVLDRHGELPSTPPMSTASASPPAHARLSCPDRMPTEVGAPGPADRFVPFRADYLIICRYLEPGRPGRPQQHDAREVDGPEAAALLRRLDALSTVAVPCPLTPPPHYSYLIEVVGASGRATLTGGDTGCRTATNGRRTGFGVNWPALLAG